MIVGTAGHVDHGKSTLVRLLTGTEPDRWEEERRRGLSIGLGYASFDADGVALSIIDVPGHSRFLSTMLRGAHAVDLAIVVVAAHEGWMPQTEAHVSVLDALGTPTGFVVLTHRDRVDQVRLEAVRSEVRDRVSGTFLASEVSDRPIPAIDATTGDGLDEVTAHLVDLAGRVGPHRGWLALSGRARLWVDRTFALDGVGRVCTGTLTGGSLTDGEPVTVHSHSGSLSSTFAARVASLQVHNGAVEVAETSTRVGVRLASRVAAEVGDALGHADQWRTGAHLHAALRPLRGFDLPTQRRGFDLVVGTGRWAVELRRSPLVQAPLPVGHCESGFAGAPGAWDPVRLHCASGERNEAVGPVEMGDRFVLVDSSTGDPVAGGILLAVDHQTLRRSTEDLSRRLEAILAMSDRCAARDGADLDALEASLAAQAAGDVAAVGDAAVGDAAVGDNVPPTDAQAVESARVLAIIGDRIHRRGDLAHALSHEGIGVDALQRVLNADLAVSLKRQQTRAGRSSVSRDRREVVELVVSSGTLDALRRSVEQRLVTAPASLAELRDHLGLSRADTLALIEHFDRVGLTAVRPDGLRVLS